MHRNYEDNVVVCRLVGGWVGMRACRFGGRGTSKTSGVRLIGGRTYSSTSMLPPRLSLCGHSNLNTTSERIASRENASRDMRVVRSVGHVERGLVNLCQVCRFA